MNGCHSMESSGMPRPCHCPCKPQNRTAPAELDWRTRVRRCFLKNKHFSSRFHFWSTQNWLWKEKKLVSFLEAILAKSQLFESLFLWGFEVARPVGTMEEMDANHDPGSLIWLIISCYYIWCYFILFPIMDSDQEISRVNYTYMIRAVRVVAEGESSKSSPVPTSHSP